MFLIRRKKTPPAGSKDVEQLLKVVEQLRMENTQLREQLLAKEVHLGEYLHKWRAVALPLLGSEWELCYCQLSGCDIKIYKDARDTCFNPTEQLSVVGCAVAWEGQRARRWVVSLLDTGGALMLRLGADSEAAAHRWLEALLDAGCTRNDELLRLKAPAQQVAATMLGDHHSPCTSLALLQRCATAPPERHSAGLAAAAAVGVTPASSTTEDSSLMDDGAVVAAVATSGLHTAGEAAALNPQHHQRRSVESTSRVSCAAAAAAGPSSSHQPGGGLAGQQAEAEAEAEAACAHGATGVAAAAADSDIPITTSAASHTQPSAACNVNNTSTSITSSSSEPASARTAPEPSGGSRRGVMLGSTPVHTAARFSILSSERTWHEKHTGLYNLGLIILIVTNFRLALENALKYGWRYNPVKFAKDALSGEGNVVLAACYPLLAALCLVSLGLEVLGHRLLSAELQVREVLEKREDVPPTQAAKLLRSRRMLHEWLLLVLIILNTTSTIVVPWAVIYQTKADPIAGGTLIMLSVVCWMKLVSYHHCCWDLRMARRAGELRPGERGCLDTPAEGTTWGHLARYPENLTARNLGYFMLAPTLTYQVNYPRSKAIRKKWLLRRCFELLITVTALTIIIHQYLEPAVANTLAPFRQMDWPRIVERVLKLALPSMYAWLCIFYCLFHVWLNILAELLRFGDREFYKDWWNAATVGEYWKLWNMPVHKWLLRHVYFPAIKMGMSRYGAILLVFFVSAVFHELVLGVPLHMVRLWAFTAIMMQVPLILITDYARRRVKRDEVGNIIFWVTFCVVGQPITILMYYHDYIIAVRPGLMALRQQQQLMQPDTLAQQLLAQEAGAAAAACGAGTCAAGWVGSAAAAAAAAAGALGVS